MADPKFLEVEPNKGVGSSPGNFPNDDHGTECHLRHESSATVSNIVFVHQKKLSRSRAFPPIRAVCIVERFLIRPGPGKKLFRMFMEYRQSETPSQVVHRPVETARIA
jgi:hypothetical protein